MKQKKFPDDNFKFDKNGRKFFKLVENTMRKGEIACYEFLQVCLTRLLKTLWERITYFPNDKILDPTNKKAYAEN